MAVLGGVGVFEVVHHADALDGLLLDAVNLAWLRDACGLKDGGGDVDDVMDCAVRTRWVPNSLWARVLAPPFTPPLGSR